MQQEGETQKIEFEKKNQERNQSKNPLKKRFYGRCRHSFRILMFCLGHSNGFPQHLFATNEFKSNHLCVVVDEREGHVERRLLSIDIVALTT